MSGSPRRLKTAAFSAVLAAFVAACGSGSTGSISTGSGASSPHTQPPAPRLSAVQLAKRAVGSMVLNAGDLPGFTLHSSGGETLTDQLPRKGKPHFALIARLVRQNWLASEHSDVVSPDGRVQLISDANLFKTAAATARIWKLELSAAPGIRTRTFPTPDGLPPGATFRYESDGRHAGFEVGWRQGPALAFVILFAHPTDRFTATAVHRISAFLGTAGRAEARRIATVERTAESA